MSAIGRRQFDIHQPKSGEGADLIEVSLQGGNHHRQIGAELLDAPGYTDGSPVVQAIR